MTESFALDEVDNPHPAMLQRALQFRRAARDTTDPVAQAFWLGYLDAMCDATGETSEAINGWMDRHEIDVDSMKRGTPVDIGTKP